MSARERALAELRDWAPPDERQRLLRADYVGLLEAHDDALLRSCYPAHLTAGAVVLAAGLDAVLLNLHRKARRWFHFGGHVESSDLSLWDAGSREALEESGVVGLRVLPVPVQLNRHTVAFCDPRGPVDHLDVRYVALAPAGAEATASDESLAVRWWPLGRLPGLEPEMHELIALARDRAQEAASPPSSRAPAE